MAIIARLRIKHPTAEAESMLIHKYGFFVHSRYKSDWVILSKEDPKNPSKKREGVTVAEAEDVEGISSARRKTIIRRCETLRTYYQGVDGPLNMLLHDKLDMYTDTLTKEESAYAREWIFNNVD